MNADDLLRRALDCIRSELGPVPPYYVYGLVQEIEEYLYAPESKDDLLGYLHPNGVFDGPMPMHLVFPIALYAHPPTKTAPKDSYDFSQVIPLTHRKAKGIIQDKNFYVTGFVLTQEDGDKCIVDMSAVRWLSMSEFHDLMHPPIDAPKDEPMNSDLVSALRHSISGYFDDAYVYGDELLSKILEDIRNHPTKTAPKKPMTEEEIKTRVQTRGYSSYEALVFENGIRFAERHHDILENPHGL